MTRYYLIILSICFYLVSNSQDFSYGKIAKEEFEKSTYAPHAEAIVLQEFGKARVEYQEIKQDLVLRFYYHTKILIKNKEGLEYGNFTIPLFKSSNNSSETIHGIKGTTYHISAEGKIEKTDLDKKNIITEKSTDNINLVKIALPNVKENCIVELRYTTESPFLYNLESWKFQDFIPKIHSEFVTEIPELCLYNVNMKGYVKLESKKDLPYDTKIVTGVGDVRGTQTTYIAKDIPAFINEDYMTSAKNFMGRLTFELASFSIPFGPRHNFSRSWTDVKDQLFKSESFGKELNRASLFKNILPTILKDNMNTYDKANAIYDYIKSHIKWNKSYGLFCENGAKEALEQKNGNVADINLALISALRAAKIDANPVILSTRDNGLPSLFRPTITDYNYVITHVLIDSQEYLLDASDIYSPFGQIPFRCVNYQGYLFKENGDKSIELKSNLVSKIGYEFHGDLDENGNLKGQLTVHRNGYLATNKREEIKSFNSIEEYVENLEESTVHYKIKNHQIDHLDNPSEILSEVHQIEFNNFASKKENELKFIPFITGRTSKNPFNLDERTYPVDLGSNIEESYILNIKLPSAYKIANKPKNLHLTLPNKEARYLYIIKENEGMLSIQILSQLNKALFLPDEYHDLKEFFSHIIQSQSLDLTIGKPSI
ncbi:DUF3857 domain-containing protein [Sphingobacterium bovistauri]|uniref:DUF3857 domain-containing protein n=1 Tax=Sphingobacterium bovistauri TaxID=2781959 RepID=A0ABS7Z5A6_9SPHI|nr:DUF3857 domain-containing protein [Sphingobacterium bovistauri]MCA5005193.1 DUF3857 domain-containing protein [Sphingobacterium bovistauri]